MSIDSVLIFVAGYPTAPHVHDRTLASIEALAWQGDLKIIIDNNDDAALGHYENLAAKHNRARRACLAEKWDALLLIEADMIVPANAMELLAAVEADVAYGLYCSRKGGMWLCFPEISQRGGMALNGDKDAARAAWGRVVASQGAGFGCTLIGRHVLERVQFRHEPKGNFADDWHFALDVHEAGYSQAHHCGVVCGHIVNEAQIIWPDPDQPDLVRRQAVAVEPVAEHASNQRYIALRPILLNDEHRRPGDELILSSSQARALTARRAVAPAVG